MSKMKDALADQHELESMVDQYGLRVVMVMLANICFDKAEHVRSNWQDDDMAMSWERDANVLEGVAVEN
jgi:hypothetical protein